MSLNLQSAGIVVGLLASIVVVGTAAWAIFRSLIDSRIQRHGYVPHEDVETIKLQTRQLTPNHGTHLADDVRAIKAWVADIRRDQLTMDGKVDKVIERVARLEGAQEERRHKGD